MTPIYTADEMRRETERTDRWFERCIKRGEALAYLVGSLEAVAGIDDWPTADRIEAMRAHPKLAPLAKGYERALRALGKLGESDA